ncbi:hypothetical protein EJB05_04022, partial [Eragrostis curvula]
MDHHAAAAARTPAVPLPSKEPQSSHPPEPEKESSRPDWLMLDGVLRGMSDDDFKSGAVAFQYTSTKDIVAISIRAAPPPRISCLAFDWRPNPERPNKPRDCDPWPWLSEANAVAAHRSCILLRLVPFSNNYHNANEEFFVYRASPVSSSLTRLPSCAHRIINLNSTNHMGILCRDDGEFAVAHLTVTSKRGKITGCPVTADLCCMFSHDLGSWRSTTSVPIRYSEDKAEELFWWTTDTVVAFGDHICWVDYLRGILFCDVLSPNPELQYVPLPVNPFDGYYDERFGGRGTLSPYRTVCVTKDDVSIKFVDIAPRDAWFYGRPDYSAAPSAITSWTLSSDRLTWVKDGDIKADEFADLIKHLDIPDDQPEFPLVDINDPQTIYLVSRDWSFSCPDRKASVLAVNMFSKKIDVPVCYSLRSLKSSGEDVSHSDTTSCNMGNNLPFIPCEFFK